MTHTVSSRPRLAVVIVTWNVRKLVLACLDSLLADLRSAPVEASVWVVDNRSADGTAQAIRAVFPDYGLLPVHVLEPGENLGFARGNNHALRALGFPDGAEVPDYVLLLNPDTVVMPGAIAALIDGLEAAGAGLAGARLIYPDGRFQHSAFAFPGLAQLAIDLFPALARLSETALNGRYPRALYEGGQPFRVDHPLGATFLLRAAVIRQTGLFDEQFHLYCEEVDWALRIRAAGWTAVCVPAARVVHYGGMSTSQVRPESIVNLWAARLRLYRKHYPLLRQILARMIVRAGMNRLIQQTARDSASPEEPRRALVQAYRQVIRLTREL